MLDRLSDHNPQSNARATDLFKPEGSGNKGRKFFMFKPTEEEKTGFSKLV